MIQRIQSLYLFVAAMLLLSLFFFPIVSFSVFNDAVEEFIKFMPFGITTTELNSPMELVPTFYYGVLLSLALLLTVLAIFSFTRRWIQIRLCFFVMVLELGVQVFIGYYCFKANVLPEMYRLIDVEATPVVYSPVCVVPVAAIVLTYLAFRGILKDELLIKSLNRIR